MEESMDWLKNRTVQLFIAIGFLGGLLFLTVGLWLEFNQQHLPLRLWSFLYVHRTEPMVLVLDLAPFVFGAIGGLLGSQYRLSAVIAQGKKEWEMIFDAFSDPILVTDTEGHILRCNHTVVDRLNATFASVIGRPLCAVFNLKEQSDLESYQNTEKEF